MTGIRRRIENALAAAAHGSRGRVEVRDAGDQVVLTDETPSLHAIDLAGRDPRHSARRRTHRHQLPDRRQRPHPPAHRHLRTRLRNRQSRQTQRTTASHRHRRRPPHDRPTRPACCRMRSRLHQHAPPIRTCRRDYPRRSRRPRQPHRHQATRTVRTIDLRDHCRIWLQLIKGRLRRPRGAGPPYGPGRAAVSWPRVLER
jgi:hypothetical protein